LVAAVQTGSGDGCRYPVRSLDYVLSDRVVGTANPSRGGYVAARGVGRHHIAAQMM